MTGTSRFRANAIIAADVYGPTPGKVCKCFLISEFWILDFGFWMKEFFLILNTQDSLLTTVLAQACNLNALELNHNHDRCLSKSLFDALANVS